jgi:hypothetical protein
MCYLSSASDAGRLAGLLVFHVPGFIVVPAF